MGRKSQFGVSLYHKQKPRKRPGRHKKKRNKHEKRQQKKRKKGWQWSYKDLYSIKGSWVWALIITAYKKYERSKDKN